MPGFGFGSHGSGRSAASGAGVALVPGELAWSSVRFPAENGDDPLNVTAPTVYESGILHLPGTPGLVTTGDPWLGSAGALLMLCTLDSRYWHGVIRQPYLFSNTAQTATVTARSITLRYLTPSSTSSIATPGRVVCTARGENTESNGVKVESAALPASLHRVLIAVRCDATHIWLDLIDCADGTIYAGAKTAKSTLGGTGWAGIKQITNPLTIGGHRHDQFPRLSTSSSAQSVSGYRGEAEFVHMLDINPSDANLQAIALGADPVTTLGSGNFRLNGTLVSAGARATSVTSTKGTFTNTALTLQGTVFPGSSLRRQASAQYIAFDRITSPTAIVPMPFGASAAPVWRAYSFAGLTGGAAIQLRAQDEDGNIVGADWRDVGTVPGAGSTGSVSFTLPWHPSHKAYRLTFRVSNGAGGFVTWRDNVDIFVAYAPVFLDQSGIARALNYGNGLGEQWDTGTDYGKRSFLLYASSTTPLARRSRHATTDLRDDGWIRITERLRAFTARPIALVDAAESGTTIPSFLDDDDDGGGGRKWADFARTLEAMVPADDTGRRCVTCVVTPWAIWFAALSNWTEQMYRPLVLGVPSADQGASGEFKVTPAQLDHYLYDEVTLDPRFRVVVMPMYRYVHGFGTTDASARADVRKDMRTMPPLESTTAASGATVNLVIGMEGNHHAIGSTVDLHPFSTNIYGLGPWCRSIADSAALGLGVLARNGPYLLDTYSWLGGSPGASVVATISNSGGAALDCEGNLFAADYGGSPGAAIGQSVEGFEVQDGGAGAWTHEGFTASITAAGAITIVKTSGTWAAGTKFRYRPGSAGGYSTDPTGAAADYAGASAAEQAWVKGAVFCGGVAVAGDNTDYTVA